MDSLPLEILKLGALGPVCALLMWLLVRADNREQAGLQRELKLQEQKDALRDTMFEMFKSSMASTQASSLALDGVKGALEALKAAYAGRS